uniref:Uncharacterized protein n=1 Tax=Amphimedon queenslandica TaxID=400682 RepID=A0A1X7VMP6_AMPQE
VTSKSVFPVAIIIPSCFSQPYYNCKVDLYQSPHYNPPMIKSLSEIHFNTSTVYTYNLTGNVDPERLVFLYMVTYNMTYSYQSRN